MQSVFYYVLKNQAVHFYYDMKKYGRYFFIKKFKHNKKQPSFFIQSEGLVCNRLWRMASRVSVYLPLPSD